MRRGLRVMAWLVLLALPFAAAAQDYPPPGSDTVNDWAEVLPPEAEARIAASLRAARQETGVQVVLVTMARIADHGGAGQRLESYAKGLFNAWGVGDGQRNDGILVLVATEDRAMRIALGAGYDPVWDNAAQAAIDRGFLPGFRAGRMGAGIETGMDEVIARIARPFAAGQPAPAPQEDGTDLAAVPAGGRGGAADRAAPAAGRSDMAAAALPGLRPPRPAPQPQRSGRGQRKPDRPGRDCHPLPRLQRQPPRGLGAARPQQRQ